MNEKLSKNTQLQKALRGISDALLLQFVLGTILATYAAFNDELPVDKQALLHYVFLGLHVLIALTLVIGSIVMLILAIKSQDKRNKKLAWGGMLAILIACVGGVLVFVPSLENTGNFVMSLAFIVALVDYGSWYFALKK